MARESPCCPLLAAPLEFVHPTPALAVSPTQSSPANCLPWFARCPTSPGFALPRPAVPARDAIGSLRSSVAPENRRSVLRLRCGRLSPNRARDVRQNHQASPARILAARAFLRQKTRRSPAP